MNEWRQGQDYFGRGNFQTVNESERSGGATSVPVFVTDLIGQYQLSVDETTVAPVVAPTILGEKITPSKFILVLIFVALLVLVFKRSR